MELKFPLDDVSIEFSNQRKEVVSPVYSDNFYRLNETEFSMDVKDVGCFYASNGNYININLYPKATKTMVELYLNGSTYGAILHQRQILPLHGSSFAHKGKGIMLCGESGAGKSSLTASFCKHGARFLTDDVSPIVFKTSKPYVLPLSDRIKLWEDSLHQLNYVNDNLTQISTDYHKFYFPIEPTETQAYALDIIFIIDKYKGQEVKIEEIAGIQKFEQLRNEIYRWEYLQGMKMTEADYLKKIIDLNANLKAFKVSRPENIELDAMRRRIESFIN